jgi:hypothetical protein
MRRYVLTMVVDVPKGVNSKDLYDYLMVETFFGAGQFRPEDRRRRLYNAKVRAMTSIQTIGPQADRNMPVEELDDGRD